MNARIDSHDCRDDDIDAVIQACLEKLVQRASVQQPAELRNLLPDVESDLRHFVLVELIKLDMAMAADAGTLHGIEHYVDAMPDLLSMETVPLDLLMEEIQLRKDFGETPSHDEYLLRFPQYEALLDQMLTRIEATRSVAKCGLPPEIPVGRQVDDFLILAKLGQGAIAHVYLARQISMHRLVALKVSHGSGDESQALAQFDHPNIVRVFDQRTVADQALHLLYMQYHPGGTLADVVQLVRHCDRSQRCSQLLLDSVDQNLLRAAQVVPDRSAVRQWIETAPWPTVVAWMGMQVAKALDEAHACGVLHRDVKPANVLLSAECIPQLADFNVSFAGAAGRAGAAASFGGSIAYMAPEHLRAISSKLLDEPEKVQEPADLYSLAVTLWELWQGERPFACDEIAGSWSDAVSIQLAARAKPLKGPQRSETASERVLEKVLRKALSLDPKDRFVDGAEMAGRLRLSLHPETATLFDPPEKSVAMTLSKWSPWIVTCVILLLPNMIGGCLNFQYNFHHVMTTPETKEGLRIVSWIVNLTFFPFAAGIAIWYARRIVRAVDSVRRGARVDPSDLSETLELGHRAALIGGTLWLIAGVLFPLVLSWIFPDFSMTQAVHLFMSSLICGGVAMIYPYFGMALMATLVFYPRCLSGTMQDPQFDQRSDQILYRSEWYLLIAAIIPLLGAALLVTTEGASQLFTLTALAAGIVGLLASFFAYRFIVNTWKQMDAVLSKRTSMVPGELTAAT